MGFYELPHYCTGGIVHKRVFYLFISDVVTLKL